MPRGARIYTEEGVYHILSRGNNKQWVFQDEADFRAYKKILKQLKAEQPFKLYHSMFTTNGWILVMKGNMTHFGINSQPGPPRDILSYSW